MFKKLIILLLPAVLPLLINAQDKIETDRPTETQNATLVPKGKFQAEIGFRREQQTTDKYSLLEPNAYFRYGLFKQLELRVRTPVETDKIKSEHKSKDGLEPVEVGLKARLYQAKDTSFTFTFYGHLGIPHLASKDHELDKAFYRIRLLFQNKVSEKIKISYNVGREWDNDDMKQNWMYSVSPQIELGDKWQVFVEQYSNFQADGAPKHYVDVGLAYDIGNNVQVDITGGKGLNKSANQYFAAVGLSFRL